jgi:hypothetical protein
VIDLTRYGNVICTLTFILSNDKDTCAELEKTASEMYNSQSASAFKKAIVIGVPPQAVLKPSDSIYRLQSQRFALGDRVTMVSDSLDVPLSLKGVVVGLNVKMLDVIWDAPFSSGTTLDGR